MRYILSILKRFSRSRWRVSTFTFIAFLFALLTVTRGIAVLTGPHHVLRIANVLAVAIPALHADEWQEPYKIIPIDFDNDGDTEQLVGFKKLIRVIDFRSTPPRILAREYINPVEDQTVYNQDTGDLNGDGFPDIVAASGKDFVTVILNDHGKGFGQRKDYFAGGETRGTKLADVDRDGNLDLLYTTQDDGYLKVRLGNGDGTFQEHVKYDASPKPYSIAPKDIDNDGDVDVVIPNESTNSISLLFNRGDGTFEDKVQMETTGQRANHVAVADLNNDALPDLLVANWHNPGEFDVGVMNHDSISLFFNLGEGEFAAPIALEGLSGSCWIKTADLDNDGDTDFVVSNWLSESTSVYRNDGNGEFDIQPYYTGAGNYGLLLSDFDGDGFKDILTTNSQEESFSLLLSDKDGEFDEHKKFYPAWQ